LDGAGRDYLDLKLNDFQSKLNRLEHVSSLSPFAA
jgi:hypothetical protein